MRRAGKIAAWVAGILLGLPIGLIAALVIAANCDPGRHLIERAASTLTDGQIVITGLDGRFPDSLRLRSVALRDRAGVWLTADDIVLTWAPSALLLGRAHIDVLSAGRIAMTRKPQPGAPSATPPTRGFSVPVSVVMNRLIVQRVEIGAAVMGTPAVLQISANAAVASLQSGRAVLDAHRLDAPGAYDIQVAIDVHGWQATLSAKEPAGGLIGAAGKIPGLGPIIIEASMTGALRAETIHAAAHLGAARVNVDGIINIPARTANIGVKAFAPAMQIRPDLAWTGMDIAGHMTGSFTAPEAAAHISLSDLRAGGAGIAAIQADIAASNGRVGLKSHISGMHLPGTQGDLFTGSAIDLNGDIALARPGRPARFSLTTPLMTATGHGTTRGDLSATIIAHVPDMGPLAALGKLKLTGPIDATAHIIRHGSTAEISVFGKADVTRGQPPLDKMLGTTDFNAVAEMSGQDISIKTVTINARAVRAELHGTDISRHLDFNWHLDLPDLAAASPALRGTLSGAGHIGGVVTGVDLDANITGDVGTSRLPKGPVSVVLVAKDLPATPQVELTAGGKIAGAKLQIAASAHAAPGGRIQVVLKKADWKSFSATAAVSIPQDRAVPVGTLNLTLLHINDISALAGVDLQGEIHAQLVANPGEAHIDVNGRNFAAGSRHVGRMSLNAQAKGAVSDPDLSGRLDIAGIDASGITGDVRLTAHGRKTALDIGAAAHLDNIQGAAATATADGILDGPAQKAVLRSVAARWKSLTLQQIGSTRIEFGPQVSLDKLKLAVNEATLNVAGKLSPVLDIKASLQNVRPDLLKSFVPSLRATGILAVNAQMTGSMAAPYGNAVLTMDGFRLETGMGAAMPAARVRAAVGLHGQSASVNARIDAGPKLSLTSAGAIPLQAGGALAVRSRGNVDLALLNPLLEAEGRSAAGTLALDMSVTGNTKAPAITGNLALSHGEIQDFTQGLRLSNIDARLAAGGDSVTIARMTADAGTGTIGVTGRIGVLMPGRPVDLHIIARHAKPISSDLLTAEFDADLNVNGSADAAMTAKGQVLLRRVDINIPDNLPQNVVTLRVRQPGQQPPVAARQAAPPAIVRLDIGVDAPRNIFVRGKGLDAELGGKISVAGTSAAPLVEGGFDLRRGNFPLAGTSLDFSKGSVSFNGIGVAAKLDPTLNFEADSIQGGITATLKITGFADAPKIALSSVPDLPQDEVLAHLLFGQSLKQLSPLQIAEIGAAVAELAGVTGSGGPLSSIRKGLGLDRLSVGGGTNGAGATVEAGRYVANGVYVGAKQATGGAGGTQAQVQVDLTRHLKLQTTLGTGGGSAQGATPQNDPGSSVGLSYQFEY